MLSASLTWPLANPKWAAELNPLLTNPVNNVQILSNVSLVTGNNVLNHGLGKLQQGWFLTDIQGAATVYRSADFNTTTLTLHSSANVVVSIGVF
jgi:hypothetical protein